MKRIACLLFALMGILAVAEHARADWHSAHYGGYQPWWNIFAKRYKCLTPEEERLQKFWHDYYDAMKNFYRALDHIDWVAYYKNHGYQINACGPNGAGCGRINYAPVFVSPTLQWAVPAGAAGGPPVGPPYANGHTQPMMPFPMGPYGPGNGPGPMGMGGPMAGPGPMGMGGPMAGPGPMGGPGPMMAGPGPMGMGMMPGPGPMGMVPPGNSGGPPPQNGGN